MHGLDSGAKTGAKTGDLSVVVSGFLCTGSAGTKRYIQR